MPWTHHANGESNMRSAVLILFCATCAAPLTTAATLTLAELAPGDIIITEFLANPIGVADSEGEYFEVLNRRNETVDLTGMIVRDDGSNSFSIDGLTVAPGTFAVLGNGDGSLLGITIDYRYGAAMSLGNGADEIVLVGNADQSLFRLAYVDGDGFGAGVAGEIAEPLPGLTSASDVDYTAATDSLPLGNFGSPGTAGNTRLPVVPLPPAAVLMLGGLGSLVAFARRRSADRSSQVTTAV
jgi:hypothetical protein